MKKKPKQQRNFVAKAMHKLCKPSVLTDKKKSSKMRPSKFSYEGEEE